MTIYVPDELLDQARKTGLSLSPVCQQAIREELAKMTAVMVDTARREISAFVDNTARWREMVAEDYPEDERNTRSAAGLRELARWVGDLPDTDPRLVTLVTSAPKDYFATGGIAPAEICQRMTSRYRFGRSDVARPDDWLEMFVADFFNDDDLADENETTSS
ncbi:hypothetical protein [Frankia tisae]|uniref:hypothetical protein n=1 Tax=Frankia tisae TaxID=2950104 RepID=UPI0021C15FFA|nr:hypothetical protein [Frankia tisae]